jgi:glycerate 2-kinase
VTRALVAPDSFKGTFPATAVAAAMARGLAPAVEVDQAPVADGGEGTADVLAAALDGCRFVTTQATGPLGDPVAAAWVMAEDGTTAVVEVAAASGLPLVPTESRDAVAASTRGTGELIAEAVRRGARHVLVAAGGSATTDGGAGAVAAIEEAGGLCGARITVLTDVSTPFEDAAAQFGPQKGASPEEVVLLTRRLDDLAERLARDPRGVPGTGAAGGLAGGLWATFGATIEPGAAFVLDAVGFSERLARADLVLVGEGCLDAQSLHGKIVGEIAARARAAGVPCHAVVGRCALTTAEVTAAGIATVTEATTLDCVTAAARSLC